MKIHVTGAVSLNGGDAAILAGEAAIFRSRWPDCRISVGDTDPKAAKRYLPEFDFYPMLDPRSAGSVRTGKVGAVARRANAAYLHTVLRAGRWAPEVESRLLPPPSRDITTIIKGADLVAYTGGTSLTDNYVISPKLAELRLASRLDVPYVFMQASAGPFQKPRNRQALRPVFRGARLIILRDERSMGYVADVGAPADRCVVLPDTAFALAPESQPPPPPEEAGLKLAISLRDWKHFSSTSAQEGMAAYLRAVATTVEALVKKLDARIEFSSTCQGRPEYWTDDSRVAEAVQRLLPTTISSRVSVDRLARTPAETMSYLQGFHAMISTRLHGAILATASGVPTVPIAYEFKTHEVWGQLGLGRWVEDIETLSAESLTGRVLELVDERAAVRAQLESAIALQREGALEAGILISKAIGPT